MNKAFLLFTFLFFVVPSNGFDQDLCGDLLHRTKNGFMSSSQFTSSTGNCSALKNQKLSKIVSFFIENREQIKNDYSRGTGEALEAFLAICNCNEPALNYLKSDVLRNLVQQSDGSRNTRDFLEDTFRNDKTLLYGCLAQE